MGEEEKKSKCRICFGKGFTFMDHSEGHRKIARCDCKLGWNFPNLSTVTELKALGYFIKKIRANGLQNKDYDVK